MLKKSLISHPKYGNIEITRNPRARRIIMRARPDVLSITLPPAATKNDMERALDTFGEKLLAQQERVQRVMIDENYRINTPHFAFALLPHNGNKFIIRRNGVQNTLLYPLDTDFDGEERQQWLRKVIKEAMRNRAKAVLPQRLKELSEQHCLHYKSVTLRDSQTRWGSCSSKGTISLNIHLVLLPNKLIDYVLLHELCHTVEMNHSNRFWALLNRLCNCDAVALRKELQRHRCDI